MALLRLISGLTRNKPRNGEKGASFIEAAISIPLLLLLTAGLVDIGNLERKKLLSLDAIHFASRAAGAHAFNNPATAGCGSVLGNINNYVVCNNANYTNPTVHELAIQTACEYYTQNSEDAADWQVSAQTQELTFDGVGMFVLHISTEWIKTPTCVACWEALFDSKKIASEQHFLVEACS